MYNRNLVFSAACLGMLLFGIVFLSLGAVVNHLTEKFALDKDAIGTLTVLLPLGILVGSLIFGPVVDRYGYKSLLIVCAVLVLIGLEGIAYATTLTHVQACLFLIGFGGGILNGGTNALVADISAGERGARLSLLGVFFGIGALGMPGILGVLSRHFPEETIVKGIGLMILLPVVYFIVIRFPAPKQPQGLSLSSMFGMLKEPTLLLFGFILFFQSGLEGTTNDWSPVYFKEKLGVTKANALYTLTIYVGALTATRLLLGGVLRRVSATPILFASLASAAAGAIVILFSTGFPAAVTGMCLLGVGYAACFPVVLGFIGDRYPANSGTAFSIAFVLALIGNMTVNKTMGRIAQHYGIEQFSKVLLVAIAAIAVLLFLALRRIKPTTTPQPPA